MIIDIALVAVLLTMVLILLLTAMVLVFVLIFVLPAKVLVVVLVLPASHGLAGQGLQTRLRCIVYSKSYRSDRFPKSTCVLIVGLYHQLFTHYKFIVTTILSD